MVNEDVQSGNQLNVETQPVRKDSIPKDTTILVVEDNVSNFVLIARMLGYMGIHCEWKTSGYEVVEYADTLPRLDLILMDIRLPYEDGYSALRKIRASPALTKTLVVAVTAEASLEQINKSKAAGFNGFLGKPLDMDRFPDQIRRILAIPFKKTDSRLVSYLDSHEVQAILNAPDPVTRYGVRDRAMLHVALAAALRVSELIGLRMDEVTFQSTVSILVRGKGRRERALPLWKETATALRAWLAVRGDLRVPELFVNARGEQLTRWGAAYILEKHVKAAAGQCTSLLRKRISPHVLRHTCAMIALQATHDIRKVSLWLGHSSIETTEIYTRADPTEKLDAINVMRFPKLRKGRFHPPDELIASLKGQRLWGVKSSPKAAPYAPVPPDSP